MKFLEFLNESNYKKAIDSETAIHYIKKYCSLNYFYRGMSGEDDYYQLDGSARNRKSLSDTGSYHNTIIDENIFNKNRNYPRRSNSIICGTQSNKDWCRNFGDLYVIFPIKGTNCAYTKSHDLIKMHAILGKFGYKYHFEHLGEIFKDAGVPDGDFDDIVESLEEKRSDIFEQLDDGYELSEEEYKLYELLKNIEGPINKALLKAFSLENMGIEFEDCDKIDNNHPSELWFSNNCIAIKESIFKKIKDEILK